MGKKIVAIIGSYRKEGIIDQTVEAVLKAAQRKGAETEKIYLTEKHIEFCTNCRSCSQADPAEKRGRCAFRDDMEELLVKIDDAGGLVLASPINFSTVTAVMKRFVERLIVYAYWPWEQFRPERRVKETNKKAVVITSSACPAFIGKILMPNAIQVLKTSAELVGSRVVKSIYFGAICQEEKQKLNQKQLRLAESTGNLII